MSDKVIFALTVPAIAMWFAACYIVDKKYKQDLGVIVCAALIALACVAGVSLLLGAWAITVYELITGDVILPQ